MNVHYWNEKREKIFNWMVANNLAAYAQFYKGAVINLCEKTPGYVRFVAHAVRDITNGMAAYRLGRNRKQVQYVTLVSKLHSQWEIEGLPKGFETLIPEESPGSSTSEATIVIPQKIMSQIQQLLREHSDGRQRSEDSPSLFFSAFLPNPASRQTLPQAYPEMWKTIQKWFHNHCHENGTVPTKEICDELEVKFAILEDIMLCVADRYTNTIKHVDEILEQANR